MSISRITGSSDPYERYFLSRQAIQGTESNIRNPAGTSIPGSYRETVTTPSAENDSSIQDAIRAFLPEGTTEVDEESLFMAVLGRRVQELKGDAAAKTYQDRVDEHLKALAAAGEYASVELAARAALNDFFEESALTVEEAQTLHSEAFKAAQLDDNTASLYDGIGGGDDPTVTVADIETALSSAQGVLGKFDSGEEDPGVLALDLGNTGIEDIGKGSAKIDPDGTGTGGEVSFGGGFVFKPISEKDGNLVILLPSDYAGEVVRLQLFDSGGTLLETGDNQGETNGNRPTFRFDEPGAGYPSNLRIVATLEDGTQRTYTIPDPSQRYT